MKCFFSVKREVKQASFLDGATFTPHSLPPGGRGTTQWWKEHANLKTHSPSPDSVRSSLPDGALLSFLAKRFHPSFAWISSTLVDFVPFSFLIPHSSFRIHYFNRAHAHIVARRASLLCKSYYRIGQGIKSEPFRSGDFKGRVGFCYIA